MARKAHFHCLALYILLAVLPVKSSGGQPRQTEFNDDNYQPRGAYNSLPAPVRSPAPASKPVTAPSKPLPRHKVQWSWHSHGFSSGNTKGKDVSRGVFYYQQQQGRIDTSLLCNNYRYGSLVYRDCRKAAKAYFGKQCSSQFMAACAAAGMTP